MKHIFDEFLTSKSFISVRLIFIPNLHLKIVVIFIILLIGGLYMTINETDKKELILKIDFSSFETVDKFIDLLKNNNVEVKSIGRDEYSIKI